ncbi:MAG: hypothetical protein JW753_02875 [Dehalococcoidia bacterium]|nr:hypothetical protein [Dehalococcoidia bacterium]
MKHSRVTDALIKQPLFVAVSGMVVDYYTWAMLAAEMNATATNRRQDSLL